MLRKSTIRFVSVDSSSRDRGVLAVSRSSFALGPVERLRSTHGHSAGSSVAGGVVRRDLTWPQSSVATADTSAATQLRVVVGEDDLLMREGMVRLLAESGLEVVAQAADAEDLVRKVVAHRPDVAIVDVQMPPNFEADGLLAAIDIRSRFPEIGVSDPVCLPGDVTRPRAHRESPRRCWLSTEGADRRCRGFRGRGPTS